MGRPLRSGLGDQPLLPTRNNASEIARLQALVEGRTVNGQPIKGYRRNVAEVRARIAKLQALDVPRTA